MEKERANLLYVEQKPQLIQNNHHLSTSYPYSNNNPYNEGQNMNQLFPHMIPAPPLVDIPTTHTHEKYYQFSPHCSSILEINFIKECKKEKIYLKRSQAGNVESEKHFEY
jgi:hypothetical protein